MLAINKFINAQRPSSLFFLIIVFVLPIWTKIALLIIPLLLITWILEGKWKEFPKELKRNRFAQLIILFWILHLIGVLYSTNWKYGFNDVQQKLSFIIFPLILIGFSNDKRITLNRVLKLFLFGSILSGLICLINAFFHSVSLESNNLVFNSTPQDIHWENYFYYTRLSFLYHPSYLAMYFTFSIAILFKLIKENMKGFLYQFLYTTAIIYFCFLIYLLSSRAGLATASITIIVGVIWLLTDRIKWVLKLCIIGVIALFLIIFLSVNKRLYFPKFINEEILNNFNLRKLNTNSEYDMRFYLWQCIPEVMSNNWVFGYGTGDFHIPLNQEYTKRNLNEPAKNDYNAHNQFLESLVSLGVVGLCSLVLLFFYPAYHLFKRSNGFLPILFLLIITINFLAESMLSRIAGILFFSLFYSLFFCYKEKEPET